MTMDITILILFTVVGFMCILLARIYKNTGISHGFSVMAMLVFVLLALVFVREETVTVVAGSVPGLFVIPLGLSSDHLSIIYLSFSLLAFYGEL